MTEHKYVIEVTELQLQLLSRACETVARIQSTQLDMVEDWFPLTYWKLSHERRTFIKEGLRELESELRDVLKLGPNANYGVGNREAGPNMDIAWDMYQVFKHQLWHDRGGDNMTVDSRSAMKYGAEPLAAIRPAQGGIMKCTPMGCTLIGCAEEDK